MTPAPYVNPDKKMYDLAAHCLRILTEAGEPLGAHHRGSGWSGWGTLKYVPAISGAVADVVFVWPKPDYQHTGRVYVDYVGRNREQNLARYERILASAGLCVERATKGEGWSKQFIWVQDRNQGEQGVVTT